MHTLTHSLGAVADLELAIRSKSIANDIMVVCSTVHTEYALYCLLSQVAGDMMFGHNFDIGQVCNYFKLKVSV